MSETIKQRIEQEGLIPVLRARSAAEALALVEAALAGGLSIMEVTLTVPGALGVLRELKKKCGDQVLLGAGTVLDATQAEAAIDSGAEFILSPSLHHDVIAKTLVMGKVSIPGAFTPTEVISAWKAGADYVKVFPASAGGGPSYIRTLRAPFPDIKMIPTGGVTLSTAGDYLKAGAAALGVGADLMNVAAIAAGTPELVTDTARAYLKAVRDARAGTSA
jgi:2-dehydro-3-deoxyphosphogluconate aldolase/(4S)-4-hydroxy-2-oxoglutarate aldolase